MFDKYHFGSLISYDKMMIKFGMGEVWGAWGRFEQWNEELGKSK